MSHDTGGGTFSQLAIAGIDLVIGVPYGSKVQDRNDGKESSTSSSVFTGIWSSITSMFTGSLSTASNSTVTRASQKPRPYILEINHNPAMPAPGRLMSDKYRRHLVTFVKSTVDLGLSDGKNDTAFERIW